MFAFLSLKPGWKPWPRLDTMTKVADGLIITVDELLKGLHKASRPSSGGHSVKTRRFLYQRD